MRKSSLQSVIIIFVSTMLLATSCTWSGCIPADNNGSDVYGITFDVMPYGLDAATIDPETGMSTINIGIDEQQAENNNWYTTVYNQSDPSSQTLPTNQSNLQLSQFMVYEGYEVSSLVQGDVMLNGYVTKVDVPAKIVPTGAGYQLPLTNTDIVLTPGDSITMNITEGAQGYPSINGVTLENGLGLYAVVYPLPNQNIAQYADSSNWMCNTGFTGYNKSEGAHDNVTIAGQGVGYDCNNDLQFSGCQTWSVITEVPSSTSSSSISSTDIAASCSSSSSDCAAPTSAQCSNIVGAVWDDDNSTCSVSKLNVADGPCAGYYYPPSDSDFQNSLMSDAGFLGSIQYDKEYNRQGYPYWVREVPAYSNLYMQSGYNDEGGYMGLPDGQNFWGVNYTGPLAGSNSGAFILGSQGNVCRMISSTPWTMLSEFALCTHNKNIIGWATSQQNGNSDGSEYYKADLRSVGPVSGWYFEEQSQCNGNASCICSAVDNEYGISKMAGYFGGLVSYGVANTDVYWGGMQSDKKLINCNIDFPHFNNGGAVENQGNIFLRASVRLAAAGMVLNSSPTCYIAGSSELISSTTTTEYNSLAAYNAAVNGTTPPNGASTSVTTSAPVTVPSDTPLGITTTNTCYTITNMAITGYTGGTKTTYYDTDQYCFPYDWTTNYQSQTSLGSSSSPPSCLGSAYKGTNTCTICTSYCSGKVVPCPVCGTTFNSPHDTYCPSIQFGNHNGGTWSSGWYNYVQYWWSANRVTETYDLTLEAPENPIFGEEVDCATTTLDPNSVAMTSAVTTVTNGVLTESFNEIRPTTCKNNSVTVKWPLQVLSFAYLINDPTYTYSNCTVHAGSDSLAFTSDLLSSGFQTFPSVYTYGETVNISTSETDSKFDWESATSGNTSTPNADQGSPGYYQGYGYNAGWVVDQWSVYDWNAGYKFCDTALAYTVTPLSFVSCMSGYQESCSNPAVTDLTYCVPTGNVTNPIDSSQADVNMGMGQCSQIINGTTTQILAYADSSNPSWTSLVDASSKFTPSQVIRMDDCGVCVTAGLSTDASGSPIVNPGTDFDSTQTHAENCQSDSDDSWVQEYTNSETNDSIQYVFTPSVTLSTCGDSETVPKEENGVRSLTSMYAKQYISSASAGGNIYYGAVALNNGAEPVSSFNVPKSSDASQYGLSFGIAGNGVSSMELYSSDDMAANTKTSTVDNSGGSSNSSQGQDQITTYNSFMVTIFTGTAAQNGKYLFMYIQEPLYNSDGTMATDATTGDVQFNEAKNPNTVFMNMTYDQIYSQFLDSPDGLMYDYQSLDSATPPGGDGSALWVPDETGALWFAILDMSPPPTFQENYNYDRDGKVIVFTPTAISLSSNPVTDGSNTLFGNDGAYSVQIKTTSPFSTSSLQNFMSNLINNILITFIEKIFIGVKTGNYVCTTYVVPVNSDQVSSVTNNTADITAFKTGAKSAAQNYITNSSEVQQANLAAADNFLKSDKCTPDGTLTTTKIMPYSSAYDPTQSSTQYYQCTANAFIGKCSDSLSTANLNITPTSSSFSFPASATKAVDGTILQMTNLKPNTIMACAQSQSMSSTMPLDCSGSQCYTVLYKSGASFPSSYSGNATSPGYYSSSFVKSIPNCSIPPALLKAVLTNSSGGTSYATGNAALASSSSCSNNSSCPSGWNYPLTIYTLSTGGNAVSLQATAPDITINGSMNYQYFTPLPTSSASSCKGSFSVLSTSDTSDPIMQYWGNQLASSTGVKDAASYEVTCSLYAQYASSAKSGSYGQTQAPQKISSVPLPFSMQRYGDCTVTCSGGGTNCASTSKIQICTIYNLPNTNGNYASCMSQPVTNSSCWVSTGKTQTISYPYAYIVNNDIVDSKSNVFPPCSTNQPYKSYSNCNNTATGRFCDITRNCFPQHANSFVQKDVQVPSTTEEGPQPGVAGTQQVNGATNCVPIYQDDVTYSNCSTKTSGGETYQQCTATEKSYQCATCGQLVLNGVPLTEANLSTINSDFITGGTCTAVDSTRFNCGAATYQACQENTQSVQGGSAVVYTIDSSGSDITVCNNASVASTQSSTVKLPMSVNTSAPSPSNNTVVAQSCTITTPCTYYGTGQEYYTTNQTAIDNKIKTSPLTFNYVNGLKEQNATNGTDVYPQTCTETFDWSNGLMYRFYMALLGNFYLQSIILLGAMLFVALKGFMVLMGQEDLSVKGVVKEFIKYALVFVFIWPGSWNFYQNVFIVPLLAFSNDLNMMVGQALFPTSSFTPASLFGPVDSVFNTIFFNYVTWYRVTAMMFNGLLGFVYGLLMVFSFANYILIIFRCILMYLSSLTIMCAYLTLGPIMFLFRLSSYTASFFSKWLQTITGAILSQVYMFSIISIFSVLYENIVTSVLYFQICYQSILTIPLINLSVLGWWNLTTQPPAAMKPYLSYTNASMTSGSGAGFPSFTKIVAMGLIVAIFDKFISSPLFGAPLPTGPVSQALGGLAQKAQGNLTLGHLKSDVKKVEAIVEPMAKGLSEAVMGKPQSGDPFSGLKKATGLGTPGGPKAGGGGGGAANGGQMVSGGSDYGAVGNLAKKAAESFFGKDKVDGALKDGKIGDLLGQESGGGMGDMLSKISGGDIGDMLSQVSGGDIGELLGRMSGNKGGESSPADFVGTENYNAMKETIDSYVSNAVKDLENLDYDALKESIAKIGLDPADFVPDNSGDGVSSGAGEGVQEGVEGAEGKAADSSAEGGKEPTVVYEYLEEINETRKED